MLYMVCNNTFYNIKEHKQLIMLNVCDNESQFKLRKKLFKKPRGLEAISLKKPTKLITLIKSDVSSLVEN